LRWNAKRVRVGVSASSWLVRESKKREEKPFFLLRRRVGGREVKGEVDMNAMVGGLGTGERIR